MLLLARAIAAAQVSDDFSDGDFSSDPAWSGNTGQFEVNTAGQLHLKTTGADTAVLSTPNSLISNTEWDLWMKLSFNTSVNNFARIYLVSDKEDLASDLSGYYIRVGGSDDSVAFVRQTGDVHTVLFTAKGVYSGNSVNTIRFRMIHEKSGTWRLFTDNAGGSVLMESGTSDDNMFTSTSAFGVYCKFTSSNSTKFYFDDFYIGPVVVDSVPPALLSATAGQEDHLKVTFSEAVDPDEGEDLSNYEIPGHEIFSASVDSLDPATVLLITGTLFGAGTCDTLFVTRMKDLEGNFSGPLRHSFCYYKVKAFDVVINEIMADPTPQVGLPDEEYVELYNTTGFPVSLKDWIFQAGTTTKALPDVMIAEHGFLTLTKGTLLSFYGPSVDIFTSSSTLTNGGSTLVLKNSANQVIHSVSYSMDWYKNSLKENGGWSLEMIDPSNPCGCAENWSASVAQLGGTPGTQNSISHPNPDTLKPSVKRAFVENDSTVRIIFSEPVDSSTVSPFTAWIVDGGDIRITGLSLLWPIYDQVILRIFPPIGNGTLYTIGIPAGIKDCSGNQMDSVQTVQFALPDSISVSDVIINEILPNPYPNGERFLELFNRSSRILDLKDLVMLESDTMTEEGFSPVNITDEGYLFFPGKYLVLTKDPADIITRYRVPNPECLITTGSIPGMTKDDAGTIVLARKNDLAVIDRVSYSGDMNFPLLTSPDGVSLERISPDVASEKKSNWHSAASSSGFATPGYMNSQNMEPGTEDNTITISPEIFSPDNDGKEDVLMIGIRPGIPGYVANAAVFSSGGSLVRQLIRNELISSDYSVTWDGITDKNLKAPAGIYLIRIDLFTPGGKVEHHTKPAVLGARL